MTKYNVAGPHQKRGLEGTHTLVYEDNSVVNSHLHKLKFHIVYAPPSDNLNCETSDSKKHPFGIACRYGRELVGHLISIYRPTLGFYKVGPSPQPHRSS